jgi:hypothetical protein
MTGTTQESQWPPAADVSRAGTRQAGPPGRVTANSRAHWGMLAGGAAGGVIFNAISLADGTTRHGYDWVSQPLGALSLGAGGTAQIVNFILLGAGTCTSALGWRPTLAGGPGAVWYPRLAVAAGLALIAAGVFSASHNIAAYLSLAVMIAQLGILARRFNRTPGWRAWGAGMWAACGLMAIFLITDGILTAAGGPAGVFERLAWLTPTATGVALLVRFLIARDARVSADGTR